MRATERRLPDREGDRNPWLAVGAPTVALFGVGFLLRVTFGSVTPDPLLWFGYGGLGLLGSILTIVGVAKSRRSRANLPGEAGR